MSTLSTFVVEDSAAVRDDLIGALEELAPVEVVGIAEDERSAVDWLRHHRCDLVVIDVLLKSGSALDVLSSVNAMNQKTKFVVLSNCETPGMRRRCIDLGADDVFDKANQLDDLITYCRRLARSS